MTCRDKYKLMLIQQVMFIVVYCFFTIALVSETTRGAVNLNFIKREQGQILRNIGLHQSNSLIKPNK